MNHESAQTTPAAPQGRARWSNLAGLGLAYTALAPLLMLLAGLIAGLDIGEFVFFLIIPIVVGLLGAFLVLKVGTWGKVVGIVAALATMFLLFWTAFGITHVSSFFDFVPGLLLVPGGIMAIVACIAAIVAGKRGHRGEKPVGGERTAIRVIVGVVSVLSLVSAALTFMGADDAPAGTQAAATIEAKDFEWGEDSYSITSGSTIVVKNADPFFHTATIDDLDVNEALTPGREAAITITRAGTYTLYCEPHTSDPENPGEDDMVTRLVVS